MTPCKHLDYDEEKYGEQCTLVTRGMFGSKVRYWIRNVVPYEDAPRNVQFCKLRGRINNILSCYNSDERSCHEKGGGGDDR